MPRYQNLTYLPQTPKPEPPSPDSVKMVDSEGRIYYQHPDKVARRIEQGWKVWEPEPMIESEPDKPDTESTQKVKRGRKKRR